MIFMNICVFICLHFALVFTVGAEGSGAFGGRVGSEAVVQVEFFLYSFNLMYITRSERSGRHPETFGKTTTPNWLKCQKALVIL